MAIVRTLYLQVAPGSLFHRPLKGERLYSLFRDRADDYLLGHLVLDEENLSVARVFTRGTDVVDPHQFQRLDPDVVYLEHGLLIGTGSDYWRLPERVARGVCDRGGVVIIADLDANQADYLKSRYSKIGPFMRSRHLYHRSSTFADRPVVFRSKDGKMPMRIQPYDMKVANWLEPAFYGVPEILVANPVVLYDSYELRGGALPAENVAASGGHGAKVIDLDRGGWFIGDTPFASVDRLGAGYVVTIAASISDDYYLDECPSNGTWIVQLAQLLLDESAKNRRRVSAPLRSTSTLFLSHGRPDKSLVSQVDSELRRRHGLNTWIDQSEMFPSDSLTARVSAGLEEATGVVLFWSRASAGRDWVRRELKLATRGRNKGKPVIIVRLDAEPLPGKLRDSLHIDAAGSTPGQIADSVASTIDNLHKRNRRRLRMRDT
jgi:hypothetical protein